jgi:hypothetical protein
MDHLLVLNLDLEAEGERNGSFYRISPFISAESRILDQVFQCCLDFNLHIQRLCFINVY